MQPHHGARVVLGSGFLMERQEHHLASLGVVIGVTVMVFLYSLMDAARSMLAGRNVNLLAIVGLVLSMALGVWFVRRHARAWRNYRMGYKGEEQVVEQLRTAISWRAMGSTASSNGRSRWPKRYRPPMSKLPPFRSGCRSPSPSAPGR